MEILGYISSFLGGGLITALLFVVGYTNKLTAMSTKLDVLARDLEHHLETPTTCCPFHEALSENVAVLKSKGVDAR